MEICLLVQQIQLIPYAMNQVTSHNINVHYYLGG